MSRVYMNIKERSLSSVLCPLSSVLCPLSVPTPLLSFFFPLCNKMPLLPYSQSDRIMLIQARAMAAFRNANPRVREQGPGTGVDASTLQMRQFGQIPMILQHPTGPPTTLDCCS